MTLNETQLKLIENTAHHGFINADDALAIIADIKQLRFRIDFAMDSLRIANMTIDASQKYINETTENSLSLKAEVVFLQDAVKRNIGKVLEYAERERSFADQQRRLFQNYKKLKEALEKIVQMGRNDKSWEDVGMDAVDVAKEALNGKGGEG